MREPLTGRDYAVTGDTDLLTLAGTLDMPVPPDTAGHEAGPPHLPPRRA